jgi:predicted Zn-dependent protease
VEHHVWVVTILFSSILYSGCTGFQQTATAPENRRILRRQEMVRSLGREYRFVWEPEIVAPVTQVGRALSRALGEPENSFHFYVLNKPVLNAFTSPLGDIFLFTGQLSHLNNSSELAGILAHEIAHVRAGHFEQLQKSRALAAVPGLAAAILSRGDPRVIISALAVMESYQLHFSREMETEADRLALQYLRKTEYDPGGRLGALRVIEQAERLVPSGVPQGLRTHPMTPARLAAMEAGLEIAPGTGYSAAPDPSWDRLRAVILALTEDPEEISRKLRYRTSEVRPAADDLMGVVHFKQGNYLEAERYFRSAVEGDPQNQVYAADLGAALFHQGRLREAREVLEGSLKLGGDENYSYPHYYLGEIYRHEGQSASSFTAYRRAVEASPPLSEAHYQLALFFVDDSRLGEADYHFGRAAFLRGDYADALRYFTRSSDRLGTNPNWRARIEAELRRME